MIRKWDIRHALVAAAAVGMLGAPSLCFARSYAETERIGMMTVEFALQAYYDKHGAYPLSDDQGTWIEKLVAEELLPPKELWPMRRAVLSGGELVDARGIPFIYTPPDDPTRRVETFDHPLVWWTGPNGVFDGGARDDLASSSTARFGYYWKRRWPAAITTAILLAVALPVVLVVARRCGARRLSTFAFVSVAYLVASTFVIAPLYYARSEHFPWAIAHRNHLLQFAAWVGVIEAVIVGFVVEARLSRWRRRRAIGRCPTCAYDLRGLDSTRCPECGTERA